MSEFSKEFSGNDYREKGSVTSFETSKGSVYKLDNEGRTSRFKTAEGKEYSSSGVTVYLPPQYHNLIGTLTYHHDNATVRLLERRSDGSVHRIKDVQDILDRTNVRLVFMDKTNENEIIKVKTEQGMKPAMFEVLFEPQLGFHPFEIGYDESYNKSYHYGNPITKINQ